MKSQLVNGSRRKMLDCVFVYVSVCVHLHVYFEVLLYGEKLTSLKCNISIPKVPMQ